MGAMTQTQYSLYHLSEVACKAGWIFSGLDELLKQQKSSRLYYLLLEAAVQRHAQGFPA